MAFAQVVTHLAVATPFLLLPSCRSLHVMEGGHELPKTLIVAAHHKTGSSLSVSSSACFDSVFIYTLDSHWKGGSLGADERALHFVRNPTSLALSAYLYHKDTGEDWSWEPGSAWRLLGEDRFLQHLLINRTESYTEFLRRVDAQDGIRAQIYHLNGRNGKLGGELTQIETADEYCQASSRCMQACLEDFTVSSSSYDATWRKVMDFMGKPMTPQIHECLSKHDLNRFPQDDSVHITSNSLPEWRYNALRKMVVEVDRKAFNGLLKKMGEGRLNCGASNFLHTQTGSNVINGAGYTGWLIEEKYS